MVSLKMSFHSVTARRTMRRFWPLLLIALGGVLGGCAGIGGRYLIGEVIHWTKPDFSQRQLDVDWVQCRRDNTSADDVIDPQSTKACMGALGYSYTEAGI